MAKNSIASLKKLNTRLIIIDNGSTMGSGWLREQADLYVRINHNVGYAPAMNIGLKLTTSPYIALAETDVVVPDNAFEVAEHILSKTGDAGSVHFRMVGYGDPMDTGQDIWVMGKERWCTISFCVFRKNAMGFFDEGYINANYEDWDIIHTMRHCLGWKTPYTNLVCYRHKDSATQKKLDQEKRHKEAQANREYFKRKFGHYPEDIWYAFYPQQMQSNYRPYP